MHIHYFRDIPLLLGAAVLLTGFYRNGFEIKACSDPGAPQWLCRLVFLFTGTVLIGFGVLGNFAPR
jgi:hypothetical protein